MFNLNILQVFKNNKSSIKTNKKNMFKNCACCIDYCKSNQNLILRYESNSNLVGLAVVVLCLADVERRHSKKIYKLLLGSYTRFSCSLIK